MRMRTWHWTRPQLFLRGIGIAMFMLLISGLVSACGQTAAERALVGVWQSPTSKARFIFASNRTFQWNLPVGRMIVGRYWSIGNDDSLRNAQFELEGGYGIRFYPDGQSFYIYIDGAGGGEPFYRTQ